MNNTDKIAKEISQILSHSPSSIHHFRKRNNIKLKTNRHNITDEEKQYIKNNVLLDD